MRLRIEEKKRKEEGQLEGEPVVLKKKRKIEDAGHERLELFYQSLRVRADGDYISPHMPSFQGPIKIYVRQAYTALHGLIHDSNKTKDVIMSGNPGTGKSTFAIFELYSSLHSGKFKAIVYENPNLDICCVFKQHSVEGATIKQKQDSVEGATVKQDSVECPHYAVECGERAVTKALDDSQNLYLFDCAPRKCAKIRPAKTIVFSSPMYKSAPKENQHQKNVTAGGHSQCD